MIRKLAFVFQYLFLILITTLFFIHKPNSDNEIMFYHDCSAKQNNVCVEYFKKENINDTQTN